MAGIILHYYLFNNNNNHSLIVTYKNVKSFVVLFYINKVCLKIFLFCFFFIRWEFVVCSVKEREKPFDSLFLFVIIYSPIRIFMYNLFLFLFHCFIFF